MVIVSEGAILTNGEKLTCGQIRDFLDKDLGLDARITTLGHIQRGGKPVYYDRALGTLQGCEAVTSVLAATPDKPSPFIAILENEITARPLMDAVRMTKEVPAAIQAQDFETVQALRDAEFKEYLSTSKILNSVDQPHLLLPEEKRLRIGIIVVGAPCGGMNAAVRAAVAYSFARGHHPVALYNGFSGLIRHHSDKPESSVRDFHWKDVDKWCLEGGCHIGW
jgi:6-phosphofructokinase 1